MIAKLALRNLAAHKLRLLFTVVSVVLGVAFVSGTLIFKDSTVKGFDDIFVRAYTGVEVTVKAKQAVQTEDVPLTPIPETVLTDLRAKATSAEHVYGSAEGYAAIVGRAEQVVAPSGLDQLGGEWIDLPGSPMELVTGARPGAADEVVIDTASAEAGGLKVGEPVNILTQNATRSMRLVGTFRFAESSNLNGLSTYVAMPLLTAQELLVKPGHYSTIHLKARAGVSSAGLAAQVAGALPAGYEVTTGEKEAEKARADVRQLVDFMTIFLLVFAGVSVFVGSFIIFNTFSMLVAQRTRELALLRAVGASRTQVTRSVLGEAFGIGIVGSTLGLAAGAGLAIVIRRLFGVFGIVLPATPLTISLTAVAGSYLTGLVVTLFAAYFPARRASRIPPVAALRDDQALPERSLRVRAVIGALSAVLGVVGMVLGVRQGGEDGAFFVGIGAATGFIGIVLLSPLLSRPVTWVLGWPIAALGGAVGRLSMQNPRRNPRRTAATASALMVGLTLVGMFTVLSQSMAASVNRAFDQAFTADYVLNAANFNGFSPEAVKAVSAAPGVRGVTPVRYGAVKLGDTPTPLLVADPAALAPMINLTLESGVAVLGTDEVLVQSGTAAARNLAVGGTVSAEYPDGAKVSLRVAGTFAENKQMTRPYVISPDSYREHSPGEAVQLAYVEIGGDSGQEKEIRAGIEKALSAYPNVQLQDRQQAKAKARDDVTQLLGMSIALLVLSIVIAALGIVNTLALSVIERTREIGLLRAIGTSRRQVGWMVRFEAVVIALFGSAVGIAVGALIGWALQRSLARNGIEVLSIPYGILALYLVAGGAVGMVAAIWPARRAARMDVLRAIATH
ncbi:ABC transporter permease [Actinoplanes sp. NEAU-A12]|uniref:ABC transporter permease n=1 Tax=Actinoplanes sandaracinus TaxID=3045177 RepID=A0ABT6WTE1_9ACTN|nr:ABC transporter permease [Actinoplanes sandaracinus]MDI6103016.1 ABC transporter permease [Actinoplanes sandaracinus]